MSAIPPSQTQVSTSRRSPTSALFGLFLVLAGLLFTASNLELLSFQPTLVGLLPILFAIVAIDRFAAGRVAAAFFWLAIGGVTALALFSPSFELRQIFKFWPLLVVLIGISMVLRSLGIRPGGDDDGRRGELAFFSTLRSRINDQAWTGGACIAVFGGHRIDLREAELAESGALLQVFALWGGINLTVPEGWSVSTQVFSTLGGADDKTRPPHPLPAGMPQLIVRGVVVMAGLEIHN